MNWSQEPVRWLYLAETVLLALVALNLITLDSQALSAILVAPGAVGGVVFGEKTRSSVMPTAKIGRKPMRSEKGEDR